MTESGARLRGIAPLFIVRDAAAASAFYRDRLGFSVALLTPASDPFFAIVRRDGVQLLLKAVVPEVRAQPNPSRHEYARWDALIEVSDPDALASELAARGVSLRTPIADTEDGLRGFELCDLDGYVLFFGRPLG